MKLSATTTKWSRMMKHQQQNLQTKHRPILNKLWSLRIRRRLLQPTTMHRTLSQRSPWRRNRNLLSPTASLMMAGKCFLLPERKKKKKSSSLYRMKIKVETSLFR